MTWAFVKLNIHEIWYGDSVAARVVRWSLVPLSLLYSLGWAIYLLIYRLGLKKAQKPHSRIVCIGNLVAGGTGKTPTVIFVADCLRELGLDVVIGCSGYGSPASENATVAPDGQIDPAQWGDEPAEIRELRPDLPIILGRARVTAAKLCSDRFPKSVLLMDDGFQHMPLAKDLCIILDPTTGNHFAFPAGPYRESRGSGRRRADLVIPGDQFSFEFSKISFSSSTGDKVEAPAKARLLTAVGRPDNVQRGIELAGVEIVEFLAYPDHHPLDFDIGEKAHNLPWIVTRKDWVKLQSRCSNPENIVIAERSASIEPVEEFKKWLKIKLP